jgi:hypothetical protein
LELVLLGVTLFALDRIRGVPLDEGAGLANGVFFTCDGEYMSSKAILSDDTSFLIIGDASLETDGVCTSLFNILDEFFFSLDLFLDLDDILLFVRCTVSS